VPSLELHHRPYVLGVFGEYYAQAAEQHTRETARRQRLTRGSDELIATAIEWLRKRHITSNSSFPAA
jgi:hypothetical protein